jgi:hypothetical protein
VNVGTKVVVLPMGPHHAPAVVHAQPAPTSIVPPAEPAAPAPTIAASSAWRPFWLN